MSFNFNDPTGVQALLDQIRASSAWQSLAESTSTEPNPPQEKDPAPKQRPTTESSSGSSVAALLSQLQSPPDNRKSSTADLTTHAAPSQRAASRSPPAHIIVADPIDSGKDPHLLDFDESLPILLRLSREPSFINELRKIKQDQDALERKLWEERRSIHKEYEDKLKAATIKANIIGASISKHEAEMLADAYNKELRKFDRDRALPAWDSLVAGQQAKLRRLRVPTMHVTSDPSALKLQQRVLQILNSIVGPAAAE